MLFARLSALPVNRTADEILQDDRRISNFKAPTGNFSETGPDARGRASRDDMAAWLGRSAPLMHSAGSKFEDRLDASCAPLKMHLKLPDIGRPGSFIVIAASRSTA